MPLATPVSTSPIRPSVAERAEQLRRLVPPSRDHVWKSRPNPSGARFLQFNEGRLLLRRRVDHAGVGRVADGEANPLAIFADGKFESISLQRRVLCEPTWSLAEVFRGDVVAVALNFSDTLRHHASGCVR